MADQVNFTTPVGRMVQGSLYKPQTTDADGRPLIVKNGPNAGQPRVDFFFALAIPKGPERHWAETEWGRKIWETGHSAFPQGQAQSPAFAWKIADGDSQVPNTRGSKPADREGYPGNWVLHFSGGYAPRIFNANGTQAIVEPDAVKCGYFIQVAASVSGNGSSSKPGVYLNHSMVALAGFGKEIAFGPDPTQAGFGGGALPPGASAVPVEGFAPPAAPLGAAPAPAYAPPTPIAGLPPVATGPAYAQPIPAHTLPAASYAPPAPPLAVQPHTGFLAGPGAPPALPPALPPATRTMLPAANSATYEQMVAAGWTDALLIQHGMMAP